MQGVPQIQPCLRDVGQNDVHPPSHRLRTFVNIAWPIACELGARPLTSTISTGSFTVHTMIFFPAALHAFLNLQAHGRVISNWECMLWG